jgi:cbb3-type cytochrome oxidase subunit 3
MARSDPINFTVSIAGWNATAWTPARIPLVWFYIWLKDNHSGLGNPIAFFESRTFTGNGTFPVSIDSDQLPFDGTDYLMYTILFAVDPNNISNATAVANTFPGVNFSIRYPSQPWDMMASLKTYDPPCYDLFGARVMGKGFRFSAVTNESVTLYLLLVDKDKKLISVGTRSLSYAPDSMQVVDLSNISYGVGFHWNDFIGKTNAGGSWGNYTYYFPRQAYYYYIGVRTDTMPGGTSFHLTMLDGTGEGNDTSDVIYTEMFWSLDSLTIRGSQLYHNTVTHTYDFAGYWSYFETFPGKGDQIAGVTNTPANFVGLIRAYGVSVGMPWLPLIFAFVIIALIVGALFKFASKFHLSIPNYIYGFFIFVGVVLDWIVGFLDTWMFAFFIMTVLGVIVLTYREQITEFVDEHRSGDSSKPASERISKMLKKKVRGEE